LLNIKNSFKINKKYQDNIDKKIIILIDDVVSTGSTLNEISKILKER
jgi:competence protein ComFC